MHRSIAKSRSRSEHQDQWGRTALFDIVKKDYVHFISVQCTNLLVKAGADVNIKDEDGRTALFDAVSQGCVQCIELSLKAGADVNVTDNIGNTVIHSGFNKTIQRSFKLLLRAGYKVNVRDEEGITAFTLFLNFWSYADDTKKFVLLLFAAGETMDEARVRIVPDYLKPSAEICLKNICRETIRKHLLQMSDVNLFISVPRLPFPRLMTSYLLYDVTLDDEEENNESDN